MIPRIMKQTKPLVAGLVLLTLVAGIFVSGCASKPPHRSEIQVQLLRTGNFHIPPKTTVTLAALPKTLNKMGGYPDTVIMIQTPPATPEATKKQITRVLKAKGNFLRVLFVGPRKAKATVAPQPR